MARFSDSNTNYVLSGILTPLDSEDAANKQYVDDLINGLEADTDTTYTFSFDTDTRVLTITPSIGDAQTVTIPGGSGGSSSVTIGRFTRDSDGLVPAPTDSYNDTEHFLAGDGTWRHIDHVTNLFVNDTEFLTNIVNNFDTEDINNIFNRIVQNSGHRFNNDTDGIVPAPGLGTDSDAERFFLNADAEWEKLDIEYIEGIIGDPGTLVTSADYTITSNAPTAGQVQLRRANDTVIDTDTDFAAVAQYVLRPANEQQRTLLGRMAIGSKLRVLSTSPVGAGYYTLTGMTSSSNTYTLTSTGSAAHYTVGNAVQGNTVEFSLKPATFDLITGNSVVFNTIVNDHLVDNTINRNKMDFGGEHPTATNNIVGYDIDSGNFTWNTGGTGSIEGLATVDTEIIVQENYRLIRHDSDLTHFGPHSYIDRSFADAQYQRKIARGNTLDITQFGTSVSTSGVVAQTTSGTGNSISTSTGGWGFSTANNSNLTGSISWVSSTPSNWSDIGTNATYQYFVFKQAGSPPGGLFAALYEGINNQPVRVWMYADAENWGLFDWPIHDVNSNGTGANNIQGTRNYPLVLVASRGNPSANMRVGLNIQNSGGTAAHLDVVVPVNERNWYLGADEAWHDGYDVFGRVADITENTHLIGNLQNTLTGSWGLFPRVELSNDVYGPLDYTDFAIGDSDITITYLAKDDQFWLAIDSEIKADWDASSRGQAAIDLHTFYYDTDEERFIERRISADFGRDTYNRLLSGTTSVDTEANTFTLQFNNQSTNNIRVLDENGNAIGNPQDEDYGRGYFNKFVVYSNATSGTGVIIDHNDFANIGESHFQYVDNHDDRVLITRPNGISAYSISDGLIVDTDNRRIILDTDYITSAGVDTDTVRAGTGIRVVDTDSGVRIEAEGVEFTLRQDTDVTFGTLAAVRWDSEANEITFVESDPFNNLIPDTNHLNRSDGAGTTISVTSDFFGNTFINFTAGTTFANAMAALPASTRQAGIVWEFSLVDVDGSEVNFDIAGNHVTAPGGGVAISFNRAMAVLRGTSEAITALSPGGLQATSSIRVYTPGTGSERTFRNITIPTIQDVFDSESTGLVPAPGAARFRADQYLAGDATWHNGYDSFGRAGTQLENTHRISNLESRLHDGVGLWDARLDDDSEIVARSDFSDVDVTSDSLVLSYYNKDETDWQNVASTLNSHWNAANNRNLPGVFAFHFRFFDADSDAFVHRRIDMFFRGSEGSDDFVFVNTSADTISFQYDSDVVGGIAVYNEFGDAIGNPEGQDFGRGYIDHIVVYSNSQSPSAGPILVTSDFGTIGYPNYPYRTFGSGDQFLQIRYDAANQQPYLHGIVFDTDSFVIDSDVETVDKTLLITDTDAERIVRKIDLAGSASGSATITYDASGNVQTVPRYVVERDGTLTLYTRRVVTHTSGSLSGYVNRLEYYRGAYNSADTSNLVGVKTFVYDGSGNILRSPITAT